MSDAMLYTPHGCVLYLDLRKVYGDKVYDYSGSGNHGTIYGAKLNQELPCRGLEFDGVDDYVEVKGDVVNFNKYDEFTIIVWVNRTEKGRGGIAGYESDATAHRSPSMWFYPDETSLHFGFGDGTTWLRATVSDVLDVNKWFMVALRWRYDEGVLEGIVDGKVVGYVDTGTSRPYPNTVYHVGRVDLYHKGLILFVMIYNRALSNDEIKKCFEDVQRRILRRIVAARDVAVR